MKSTTLFDENNVVEQDIAICHILYLILATFLSECIILISKTEHLLYQIYESLLPRLLSIIDGD